MRNNEQFVRSKGGWSHPTNHPSNQPTNQPASQPTIYFSFCEKPINLTSRKITSQPANQPASQPTSMDVHYVRTYGIRKYVRTRTYTNVHTYVRTQAYVCTNVSRTTYLRACVRTCTQKQRRTYVRMPSLPTKDQGKLQGWPVITPQASSIRPPLVPC